MLSDSIVKLLLLLLYKTLSNMIKVLGTKMIMLNGQNTSFLKYWHILIWVPKSYHWEFMCHQHNLMTGEAMVNVPFRNLNRRLFETMAK